jgi:hypothetical protein
LIFPATAKHKDRKFQTVRGTTLMFGLVYTFIAWVSYHLVAKPAQQLYKSACASVRHSRLNSWQRAEGTITGVGATMLGGRRQQFTPYGPVTYTIPRHWKVGVSYYYTVNGEYYASADNVIVHILTTRRNWWSAIPRTARSSSPPTPLIPIKLLSLSW